MPASNSAKAWPSLRSWASARQSYGKGRIVGLAGEQEHANALLTTAFANPIRAAIGGDSWISSFTKKGGPGTLIDIPMNHKDEIYVRSHCDGMSVMLPDTPMSDEIAVIFLHRQSRTPQCTRRRIDA
jgi:Amino acid synthesis